MFSRPAAIMNVGAWKLGVEMELITETGIDYHRQCTGVFATISGKLKAKIQTTHPDAFRTIYVNGFPKREKPVIYDFEVEIGGKRWETVHPDFQKVILERAQRYVFKLQKHLQMSEKIQIVFVDIGDNNLRFIEAEDMDGKSVNLGEWIKRSDGLPALVVDVASGVKR